jgi:hypothetical protein
LGIVPDYLTEQMSALFGFEIKRDDDTENKPAFAPKVEDDGAIVTSATPGDSYAQATNFEGQLKSEAELINKYRAMAGNPEVDSAITDIVNEAICREEGKDTVEIDLEEVELTDGVKSRIDKEFKEILRLLEFNTQQSRIFRRWYIDGRLYYHAIVDETRLEEGIQELRYLEPRRMKKVRKVVKTKVKGYPNLQVPEKVSEFFLYTNTPLVNKKASPLATTSFDTDVTALKIAVDSIVYSTSGLTDETDQMIIGYLHQVIKPLNALRSLEDASVIYTLARAPQRRVFYIDVGTLPRAKADQLIREVMTKHKNKMIYDTNTGEMKDDRRFMTMLDNYYLGRRGGGKGTEIDTLDGSPPILDSESLKYFRDWLYNALHVPISRLKPEEAVFTSGRATEITRDEIKFSKFIDEIRLKFSELFIRALEKQLVLKKVLMPEDWEAIKNNIKFNYTKDNYFAELKESEILAERLARAEAIMPFVGRFYSNRWVRMNVLKQTEEEMKEIDAEIEEEATNPQYMQPFGDVGPDMGGPPGPDQFGAPPGAQPFQPQIADQGQGALPPPQEAAKPELGLNLDKEKE